jgi:hypothetical protein
MDGVGRAIIKGGTFFNNGGGNSLEAGAVSWWSGYANARVKGSLQVTGVNFTSNSAQLGGAVLLLRFVNTNLENLSRVFCVHAPLPPSCLAAAIAYYSRMINEYFESLLNQTTMSSQLPSKATFKQCIFDRNTATNPPGSRGSAILFSSSAQPGVTVFEQFTLALPGAKFTGGCFEHMHTK